MDRLQNLLESKEAVLSAWSGISDYIYLSALADSKFDAITLDMQHGMQTEAGVLPSIATITKSGKPVVVRIPIERFELASKALDAGAHAIIAPMINTKEQAEKFVEYTKYPPMGKRSFGPAQALGVLGVERDEYMQKANEKTFTFAMLETKQALENLESIVSTKGIDGIFCGPADLSISLRNQPKPEPFGIDTIKQIEKISTSANQQKKLSAIFCTEPTTANIAIKLGYKFIAVGFDATYIKGGAENLLSAISQSESRKNF